jgi:hypothetical protein
VLSKEKSPAWSRLVKGLLPMVKGCSGELWMANSLGVTVILPAGDVFMFKGMDCDENYNVFTTIFYDTLTSGKVTAHASSDIF